MERKSVRRQLLVLAAVAIPLVIINIYFAAWYRDVEATRDYAAGDIVSLGDGISMTVPPGYEASYRTAEIPRAGSPSVFMSAPTSQTAPYSAPTLNLEIGSATLLDMWESNDAAYRSYEQTGVFTPAHDVFVLDGGWTASVTTRNEDRHNRPPTVAILASLSRPESKPLRITAFYRESFEQPSIPPDPKRALDRVQRHLGLVLPQE